MPRQEPRLQAFQPFLRHEADEAEEHDDGEEPGGVEALRALLHQRTEIAYTLQRSLLPASLPFVPGAEVAVQYLAGAEGVDVGGDFYDVIPLANGRMGLVVGDVMLDQFLIATIAEVECTPI